MSVHCVSAMVWKRKHGEKLTKKCIAYDATPYHIKSTVHNMFIYS
jgi:hypothetical protein